MTSYEVPDSPKMLRETLCIAMTRIGQSDLDEHRKEADIARLQRLADACDVHRPLGPDGKHGDRHTPTCGCEDVPDVGPFGPIVDPCGGCGCARSWHLTNGCTGDFMHCPCQEWVAA